MSTIVELKSLKRLILTGHSPNVLVQSVENFFYDENSSVRFNTIKRLEKKKAEDIYTAAGWESMYQNGYLHGSPSRFSAKSAIYTAAG